MSHDPPSPTSATRSWAALGAAFGCAFPLLAGGIRVAQGGVDGAREAFAGDPLLWIILSAPLFLGGMAALGGRQQDRLRRLGERFEAEVSARAGRVVLAIHDNAESLSRRAGRFGSESANIAEGVEQTRQEAASAAVSAGQVSAAVQAVAVGVEELGASMRGVARSARRAAEVGGEAVSMARRTEEVVRRLGSASEEIDVVVQSITRLAQQTQRLALNARIEAARAGPAGLGFAVVAQEVKQLADRSALAASEVVERVDAIRTRTTQTVEAIGAIAGVVEEINGLQESIATAVSEQTAVAHEASVTLTGAANGTAEVAESLATVVRSAERAASGIVGVAGGATELGALAADLGEVAEHLAAPRPGLAGGGAPTAAR